MPDVGIVGAGPVGLCMAALLLQRGLGVAVFEKRPEPGRQSRAIGIHPPALAVLESLGAAAPLLRSGVQIRRGTAYSAGRRVASLDFDVPGARYPFILSVPQARTLEVLEQRVTELDPAAVRRGVEIQEVVPDDGGLLLRGSRTGPGAGSAAFESRCSFLIAADGAHSTSRDRLHITPKVRRYPDHYLMGDFRDETPYGAEAVLFLEPGGIVECFPLPGAIRRWVVRLEGPSPEPSVALLAALIRERTGTAVDTSSNSMLSSFGVRSRLAGRMVHGRIALLGDAAHELSPIGGQGMNLGWLDAAALAPLLEQMVRTGIESVRPRALERFERGRARLARKAARQAGINMALGRPLNATVLGRRNAAIAAAMARPAVARFVARRFTMH